MFKLVCLRRLEHLLIYEQLLVLLLNRNMAPSLTSLIKEKEEEKAVTITTTLSPGLDTPANKLEETLPHPSFGNRHHHEIVTTTLKPIELTGEKIIFKTNFYLN